MKTSSTTNKEVVNNKNTDKSSNKFYQFAIDNLPGNVIAVDKDGRTISVNKHYKDFFCDKGYENNNIFLNDFFIRENILEDFKKLLIDGTLINRSNCTDINYKGETKYLKIIGVPFWNEKGEIGGAIFIALDNTDAVVLKNTLSDLNNDLENKIKEGTLELDEVNKKLAETINSKSIFISEVTHEFRTALTIMQCSLELITKSGDIKKENLDLFKNITIEIKRVSNMLADLSLLAKFDIDAPRHHYRKINLNHLVLSICKELGVVADEKQITIEYKENRIPVEIMADKENIEKLLRNLIGNSIKYVKNNGWIKVGIKRAKNGVNLKIEDNGLGIPEIEIPHIFERFYQTGIAKSRGAGGSGLGLAICQNIVEMHEGKIRVSSKVGKGTIFTIFLPYVHKK